MTIRKDNPFGSSFVLDETREFIGTLVWAPAEYLDTMTLVIALTHALGTPANRRAKKPPISSVPHVLVTSKNYGVGKSTFAAQVPMLLASRPWAVGRGTTEPAINSRFLSDQTDCLVLDDSGKVFGENGLSGKLTKLYDLLIKCYLSSGVISVSVNRIAKDLPAFAVAFMNGLEKATPDDLRDRAIVMEMPVKPARIRLADALSGDTAEDAQELRENLADWAGRNMEAIRLFLRDDVGKVHPALVDRPLQKWGGLFAVASAAGGDWPQRCMDAFLRLALGSSQKPPVMRYQKCLMDAADVIAMAKADRVFTADLIAGLRALPEGEYYEEASTDYLVKKLLPKALGPSQVIRRTAGGQVVSGKGWMAAPVLKAAAQLRQAIYAKPEPDGPGEVERELMLRVVG